MVKRIFAYLLMVTPLVFAGVLVFAHHTEAYHFDAQNTPAPALHMPAPNYCIAPVTDSGGNTVDTSNTDAGRQNVLSFIEYGESYSAVGSDAKINGGQAKVDKLLADPTPRDSSGLVPCGRQCDDPTTAVNEAVPCNFCHIFVLFHNIVNTLLKWALLLAILLVAAGGFMIMVSGGSTGAGKTVDIAGIGSLITGGGVSGLRQGRAMITSALIGYAIMLSAWIIVNIFFSLIGIASWVGIGSWWQPNCPVPGAASSATSPSPASGTSGSAASSTPSSSGSPSSASSGSSSAPATTSGSSAISPAPLDFTRLNNAILSSTSLKNLYTSTGKIGTGTGLIPVSALDTFQKAIDAATNVRDGAVNEPTSADQAALDAAAATLEVAEAAFTGSVIR